MSDLMAVFQEQAPKYDLLVCREDYQGNLLKCLCSITPLAGRHVVELGAGTGRLTRQLAPMVEAIEAFDAAEPMLKVAEARLRALGLNNWRLEVADNRKASSQSGSADVVVAAWSICCLAAYEGEHWQRQVQTAVDEMHRVAVPGGTMLIIETLGTGYSTPNAPAGLRPYYELLELKGFTSVCIRTDYLFHSMNEAVDLTTFFFGKDPLGALVQTDGGVLLPECTGVWSRKKAASEA